MEDRRWILISAAAAADLGVLVLGFVLGSLVGSSSEEEAAPTSTTSPLSSKSSSTTSLGDSTGTTLAGELGADQAIVGSYGSPEDRGEFVRVVRNTGIVTGTEADLLTAADEICYHLERLQAQERSAAYAVRVVWNEALAPLESEDLASFGTIFIAAPHYLCPENAAYAEDVSYWLGY